MPLCRRADPDALGARRGDRPRGRPRSRRRRLSGQALQPARTAGAAARAAAPCPSRRASPPQRSGNANSSASFGPFTLDLAAHRLLRDGVEVRLTSAEFDLLRVFTERPNRVLSRDNLVDLLKGFERGPFDRSVDIRVTRLRRKIETDPAAPAYIRTIRGEGYLFNPLGTDT